MTIAENIRHLLKVKNLTNREFCERLGVSENGFKRMLDNNAYKYDFLKQIAQILDTPVWEITGDYPAASSQQVVMKAGEAWTNDVNKLTKENAALRQHVTALEKLNKALEIQIEAMKGLHSLSTNKPNTNQHEHHE